MKVFIETDISGFDMKYERFGTLCRPTWTDENDFFHIKRCQKKNETKKKLFLPEESLGCKLRAYQKQNLSKIKY